MPPRHIRDTRTRHQGLGNDRGLLFLAPAPVSLGTRQNLNLHRSDALTHVLKDVLSRSDTGFYKGLITALTIEKLVET